MLILFLTYSIDVGGAFYTEVICRFCQFLKLICRKLSAGVRPSFTNLHGNYVRFRFLSDSQHKNMCMLHSCVICTESHFLNGKVQLWSADIKYLFVHPLIARMEWIRHVVIHGYSYIVGVSIRQWTLIVWVLIFEQHAHPCSGSWI